MPTYILKTKRDGDLYCLWSTVVDAPTAVGTRDEIARAVEPGPGDSVAVRLDRADLHGTSALWPSLLDPIFGWGDEALLVMHGPGAPGDLPRADLDAYCRHLAAGEDDAAAALIEPPEYEETETP